VVTAYILIQTEVGKAAQVAKDIVEIKGVQLAEDVTGPYDVIARAEARNLDELGKLVVARVQVVDGITRTLTCPVVRLSHCPTESCSTSVWCPSASSIDRTTALGVAPLQNCGLLSLGGTTAACHLSGYRGGQQQGPGSRPGAFAVAQPPP
jgi:hypothetical protein